MNRCRERANRADGCDVKDFSGALAKHLLVNRFGDGEQAVDVGINHPVPRFIGRGRKVVGFVYRGVVDEDVYAAPRFDDFARHAFEINAVGDGDFITESPPPVRFDFGFGGFREVVARVVVECHVRAFACEDFAESRA